MGKLQAGSVEQHDYDQFEYQFRTYVEKLQLLSGGASFGKTSG